MDRLATVVAAALLACAGSACAGYAQLSPPPGWSAGTGATYGTIPARAAAANAGSFWSGSTVINAGGRAITVPVAGRFAANAGRFAARGLMLNPAALGIAAAAWLAEECIAYQGGKWVITCGGDSPPKLSDGKEYKTSIDGVFTAYYPSVQEACDAGAGLWPSPWKVASEAAYGTNCRWRILQGSPYNVGQISEGIAVERPSASCPAGWYITPAGCVQTPPPRELTPQQVEDRMAPKTIPPGVFPEIPNVPLPIDVPKINPTPSPNGPASPLIVPQGDPVKVPNSNPTRWTQPEIQITPAPSPDSPFRVDIKPQDRPVGDPLTNPPRRDPWTPPVTPPVGDPNDPPAPDPDPSKDPVEKTPDLCEKYPDILACQKFKLGEVEPEKIKNTEVPLKIEKEGGFPSGGQCPAPKSVPLMGKTFAFSIEPLCDFAKAIKPLLLGFAYLTAALTFLGVARRE